MSWLEYLVETEGEHSLVYHRQVYLADQGIWIMRDGKEINVKDMTIPHIKNCLNMIRYIPFSDPYIIMFEKELERRRKESENL